MNDLIDRDLDELGRRIQQTMIWQSDQADSRPSTTFTAELSKERSIIQRLPHLPAARFRLVATGAVAACAAIGLILALNITNNQAPDEAMPVTTASQSRDVPAGSYDWTSSDSGYGGNCVAEASPESLRERGFALDGTVIEVNPTGSSSDDDGGAFGDLVRLRVDEWFFGGQDAEVLVLLQRPASVGDRLLLAGQRQFDTPGSNLVAWECGFTTDYSPDAYRAWASATAASD